MCVCVCVCVCLRARERACACACACAWGWHVGAPACAHVTLHARFAWKMSCILPDIQVHRAQVNASARGWLLSITFSRIFRQRVAPKNAQTILILRFTCITESSRVASRPIWVFTVKDPSRSGLHWVLRDATGKGLVVEFLDGQGPRASGASGAYTGLARLFIAAKLRRKARP